MRLYKFLLVEGGVYIGELKKGKPHGKGIFKYSNGSKYVGEFIEGKFEGKGVLTCIDNTTYNGEWINHHMHGRGKLICHETVQDGFWYMDNFECYIGDEFN
jgi:hypothetical protein